MIEAKNAFNPYPESAKPGIPVTVPVPWVLPLIPDIPGPQRRIIPLPDKPLTVPIPSPQPSVPARVK